MGKLSDAETAESGTDGNTESGTEAESVSKLAKSFLSIFDQPTVCRTVGLSKV